MSKQCDEIYVQCCEVLFGLDEDIEEIIEGMIGDFVDSQFVVYVFIEVSYEQWDIE